MAFLFKYLWVVCCVLICINFVSIMLSSYSIMKNSAKENLDSLATELSHRVTVSYDLLEGISMMPFMGDMSIPVSDRAAQLKPFATSFGYWMIGIVDMDGSISSTLRYQSRKVQRDYIERIKKTGRREMTDVFPSGATGDLNYSLLVPIKRDGEVVSIVFASTLIDELYKVVTRNEATDRGYYILLDSKLDIISHHNKGMLFENLPELVKDEIMLYNKTNEEFCTDLREKNTGSFVSLFNNSLYYTVYTRQDNTDLMLVHRIKIFHTFQAAVIGFVIQALLYITVFSALYYFGTMYMQRELRPVDNILKQVVDLNKELLNSDRIDTAQISDIIHISQKGLKDELTGLPTRTLFRQLLNIRMAKLSTTSFAAIFFIDMDNLKTINDSFGHKYGDVAIKFFGLRLHDFAFRKGGFCARYGGDEFVMFIDGFADIESIKPLSDELLGLLRGHIEKNDETHRFHASIGIALYPMHSTHIDVVIQLADIALYETKQKGKNGYTIYSEEIGEKKPNMMLSIL